MNSQNPSPSRKTKFRSPRFFPRIESLERREVPAALVFDTNARVLGTVSVNGSSTSNLRRLTQSNNGNLALRSSGNNRAFVSLTSYSGASANKTVTVQTSAHTDGPTGRSAKSLANTTIGNGFNYVTVRVVATQGDQAGQGVRVTLKPSFSSTIGAFNAGSASNSYSFYVNNAKVLGGTATAKGTRPFAFTHRIDTFVGATFKIAFQSVSYAGFAGKGKTNIAEMQFSLAMSVVSEGGVQIGLPPAPKNLSWAPANTNNGRDIYLLWEDVKGETSYEIRYLNPTTNKWVVVVTTPANEISTKIINGLGKKLQVGARNKFGVRFSNTISAT